MNNVGGKEKRNKAMRWNCIKTACLPPKPQPTPTQRPRDLGTEAFTRPLFERGCRYLRIEIDSPHEEDVLAEEGIQVQITNWRCLTIRRVVGRNGRLHPKRRILHTYERDNEDDFFCSGNLCTGEHDIWGTIWVFYDVFSFGVVPLCLAK